MKIWRNKFLKRMIIVITVVYLIMNCFVPNYVFANKATSELVLNIKNIALGIAGLVGTGVAVYLAIPSGGLSLAAVAPMAGAAVKGGAVTLGVMMASDATEDGVDNIPGNILEEFLDFTVAIGDVILGSLQGLMFGDMGMWSDTMIDNRNDNLGSGVLGKEDSGSWLYAGEDDVESLNEGKPTDRGSALMNVERKAISDGLFVKDYEVPNILYSPENIFANKIATLDANYINPHSYTGVNENEEKPPVSLAAEVSPTVATWYKAFRNIAIVGLLSVLVYIGIRIVIGTVSEKARYKERLQDWLVALAMIFFMHFIMAGIMMLSEKIIDLVGEAGNTGIIISVNDGAIFKTTFVGFIRFFAQANNWRVGVGYSLMYLVLVGVTCRYTFIYLKRALYLAFFTMIAPMVALTYPIDKIKDGQAQAFNVWIKEYFINAIIQPIHLLLYTTLVGSTMSLAIKNPVYGIVVLLFMPTAEKWIKSMFKMDKAPLTATSLGDVAVLGSIFGLGKNMASGVVKGAGTLTKAAVTGGKDAVIGGIKNSVVGAPFRAVGAAIDRFPVGSSSGDSVEDAINGTIEVKQNENKEKDENSNNKDKRSDSNIDIEKLYKMIEKDNDKATAKETVADIANTFAKTTQNTMNEGMEEYANMGGDTLSDMYKPEGTDKSEEKDGKELETKTDTNTIETPVSKTGSPEEAAEAKEKPSEYEKSQLQSQKVEKLTKSSEAKEISNMINKGITGALTGSAGAAIGTGLGAIVAGGLGDSKTLLAGGMAGATTATALAGEMMKVGDSVYNNNVKVLVKTEGVTNKNIIQNTAKVAQKEGWSEDKMKMVAQMAEKYPKLADNKEFQTAIATQLREAGVKSEKAIEKAINDIKKVQTSVDKIEEKENKISNKNIQNWK